VNTEPQPLVSPPPAFAQGNLLSAPAPSLSRAGRQRIALPASTLLPSTLATSYLNGNSQPPTKNATRSPPRSCKPTAWHTTSHAGGQGARPGPRCGSRWAQQPRPPKRSRAPATGPATGRATVGAASGLAPRSQSRPQVQVLHKHALVLGHVTALPQGCLCATGKPVIPVGALGLQEPAGPRCPQQEAGARQRQPPQLPAPSRSIALTGPICPAARSCGLVPPAKSGAEGAAGSALCELGGLLGQRQGRPPPAAGSLRGGQDRPLPSQAPRGKSRLLRSSRAVGKAASNSRQHGGGCRSVCEN